MITALHESPIGPLTLVATEERLAGIYFEGHRVGGPPAEARPGQSAALDAARRALDAYFAGRKRSFDLALAPRGTPFQQRVWSALAEIPFGATRTYSAIAESVGAPKAVRAVGTAIGRNPVSIVIPCHRVIGTNGTLTGYAGGLDRKRFLLDLERRAAAIRC